MVEEKEAWNCVFEPMEKCRWIGIDETPPTKYTLTCVCCRLLSVEESVNDVRGEIKALAAALAEFCVLMLKFPALKKLKPTEESK